MMITLKSPSELARMREAGRIVAVVLALLREKIAPGVTTEELNALAEETILKHGAVPSFKGYRGYPAALCVSVNEEVVHGIPGSRVINEGDLVSMDVGTIYKGFQGDAAITVAVGEVSPAARRLLEVTAGALEAGIAQCRAGQHMGDVSAAIQNYAESRGFSVVREYTGHGIGRKMHEDPQIPNFGEPGRGALLRPGMTFALEPMVTMGTWRTRVLDNGWTVVTLDGQLSAHFEHTIAVTDDEPEILTRL
ncbi:MAG: type I methionyl aminopeptidase [Chloroflexi bacterium]|nr:type I methionyl aminopeptidase [Anaerolineae bacterium]RLC73252.1 MAG: type I methionyl aminopeptidase [Chloroflexota bacterium]